jgi:lysosomal alpha-mannosidase
MHVLTSSLFLLFGVALCFGYPAKLSAGCGYQSCNLGDPSKLNVHIVPHTHDDVGWLKTVDQYYYGARNNIQHAGVQYILDSVVRALDQNTDRRFIYVEIAYFWRWWNEQTDDMRNKVIGFVNDGRLEFISGGWCMNDEAATHYSSIIDQHSLGAELLRDVFGDCARPKIGWQIDPFGHSRELASLFAQMGFDGLFFGRADYQDHDQRFNNKTMEMVWKASANLDRQGWLFTGLLPNGYGPPGSFCYDAFCADPPIMDDARLHDYNVQERVQTFLQAAWSEAKGFASNHIIMTMGSDFQYENANEWFKNLDKLITYVNAAQSNVTVFYSTPSCYLYALNKAGLTWTSKTDDFFPYAHHLHGFWTGYFTSRAAFKGYERHTNNILQVTRQLNAFSKSQLRNSIFILSEAMGLAQHHDGVSGTEKQEVVFDYAQRLSIGIDFAVGVMNQALAKLLPKSGSQPPLDAQFLCQTANVSECLPIQDQNRFTLTLWNPTIHQILTHHRVPVTKAYTVRDATGQPILAELIPIADETKNIPGRTGNATSELVFRASLPPLGFYTYFFEVKTMEEVQTPTVKITPNDECTLINQYLRVEINAQGYLQNIVNLQKGFDVAFTDAGFYWYAGFPGDNSKSELQASGAYIFRPLNETAFPVSTTRTVTCINSDNVKIARIVYTNWASQEIRLYDGAQNVEVEWTVGPIPIEDKVGKEIVLRYDTDIQSASKYYTDANGREVLERTRNFRPTWNLTINETVAGNYYPINSRIWIKDANRQLTVLTDRSEGGGSIRDGSIEVMVHRRTLHDDALGVGEPLNETAFGTGLVVRGKHQLIVEAPNASADVHRVTAQQLYMHPLAIYAVTQKTYADYSNSYRQTWSALTDTLPVNVHLLTLDQLGPNDYLVRVENYFELNESGQYSQPVTINLQSIFQSLGTITNTVELALAGNFPLASMQRLNWTTTDDEYSENDVPRETTLTDTNVTLNPMQIRTFQVTLA